MRTNASPRTTAIRSVFEELGRAGRFEGSVMHPFEVFHIGAGCNVRAVGVRERKASTFENPNDRFRRCPHFTPSFTARFALEASSVQEHFFDGHDGFFRFRVSLVDEFEEGNSNVFVGDLEQVTERIFAGPQATGSREEFGEDRAPSHEAREERSTIASVAQEPQREVQCGRARTSDDGIVRKFGDIVDEQSRVRDEFAKFRHLVHERVHEFVKRAWSCPAALAVMQHDGDDDG